jgi:hypothetical protein
MNAVVGELVTTGSTNDTALTLTNVQSNEPVEHMILVKSGTIKFGIDSVIANANGYTSDEKLIIRCVNGHLHFKGGAADTFVVTV